ncbi:hypothetical protein N9S62_03835 [Pelagibacteraceae bacterium]|nr:hypothetical protein [Pelagibacteraceae bacterium]
MKKKRKNNKKIIKNKKKQKTSKKKYKKHNKKHNKKHSKRKNKKKNKISVKKSKKFKIKKIHKNNKKKPSAKITKSSKQVLLKVIRISDNIHSKLRFNFSLDKFLQNFFQGISDKISQKIDAIKTVVEEEKLRKKEIKIKQMQNEKLETIKKSKLEKQLALEAKKLEYKSEVKLEKERKKELQKFIRLEQAEVRKEQAEKQRKFLEQIQLEKKIEQFRKREAQEIKQLEKYVLSQERDSYAGVEDRIDAIKIKYQKLRDQKIRERIEQLGIEVTDSDDRVALLAKEKQYNIDRQKIEFALESYYRSMASCVFQLNKKWIPKKMSLLRVLDYRFEKSEIYIKFDEEEDHNWLMLVYIKDNNPDAGIIVEDKTNPVKNISMEYKTNEIFKFSDALVDSLTGLLDRERNKRKVN